MIHGHVLAVKQGLKGSGQPACWLWPVTRRRCGRHRPAQRRQRVAG